MSEKHECQDLTKLVNTNRGDKIRIERLSDGQWVLFVTCRIGTHDDSVILDIKHCPGCGLKFD